MKHLWIALTVALALAVAIGAQAQGTGLLPPPDTAAKAPLLKLDFPGGTVAELSRSLTTVLSEKVVERRAYDRALPKFALPGDPPEGSPLAAMGRGAAAAGGTARGGGAGGGMMFGPGLNPLELARSKDGLTRDQMLLLLPSYVHVGPRPGWLLRSPDANEVKPAEEAMGAADTTAPKPGDEGAATDTKGLRPLLKERDGEALPFIDYRANPVTVEDLLAQLFAHTRLPFIVADGVKLPTETYPIFRENVTVSDFTTELAGKLGLVAEPVWVAYDITVDFDEYLKTLTDSEIAETAQLMGMWDQLSADQKKALLDTLWDQFKQFPPEQRAAMLGAAQSALESLGARMGEMDPGVVASMRDRMGGIYGDMSNWYAGLGAGDRSELAGLFGALGKVFGGGGGGAAGRPGF
jgi:hypothetical protein